MAKDKSISAIDAIFELLDQVKELRQEIQVINNDIKTLNNKINKLSPERPKFTAAAPDKVITKTDPVSDQLIKIFGRIKNSSKKPIKDVYITVFGPRGEIVKNRTTDSDGYWEARVLPGEYVVELNASHINKKSIPVNINIKVDETMREFEVKNNN